MSQPDRLKRRKISCGRIATHHLFEHSHLLMHMLMQDFCRPKNTNARFQIHRYQTDGHRFEWIIDTLEIVFEFLIDLTSRIKQCWNNASKQRKFKANTPVQVRNITPHGVQTFPVIKLLLEDIKHGTADVTNIPDDPESQLDIKEVNIHPYPTILYKGYTRSLLDKAFDLEHKKLKLDPLFSVPPTDFHRESTKTLYFTEHLEVAQQYAEWANNRARAESTAVLQLAHPIDVSTAVKSIDDEVWHDLAWHCRGPDKKWNEKPKQSTGEMKSLKGKNELNTWKLSNGDIGTQHAFLKPAYFAAGCEKAVWVISTVGDGDPKIVVKTGMTVEGDDRDRSDDDE